MQKANQGQEFGGGVLTLVIMPQNLTSKLGLMMIKILLSPLGEKEPV